MDLFRNSVIGRGILYFCQADDLNDIFDFITCNIDRDAELLGKKKFTVYIKDSFSLFKKPVHVFFSGCGADLKHYGNSTSCQLFDYVSKPYVVIYYTCQDIAKEAPNGLKNGSHKNPMILGKRCVVRYDLFW
jgi:hypothetical protein